MWHSLPSVLLSCSGGHVYIRVQNLERRGRWRRRECGMSVPQGEGFFTFPVSVSLQQVCTLANSKQNPKHLFYNSFDLQKKCNDSKSSHGTQITVGHVSLVPLLLTSYTSITLIWYHTSHSWTSIDILLSTKAHSWFGFLCFCLIRFCSRFPQTTMLHLVVMSPLAPLAMTISLNFLGLEGLDSSEQYWSGIV